MIFDMQGDAVLVNDAMARITGFPSAGSMKRNLDFFATCYEFTQPDGTPVPFEEWPASRALHFPK